MVEKGRNDGHKASIQFDQRLCKGCVCNGCLAVSISYNAIVVVVLVVVVLTIALCETRADTALVAFKILLRHLDGPSA